LLTPDLPLQLQLQCLKQRYTTDLTLLIDEFERFKRANSHSLSEVGTFYSPVSARSKA
jgi:hypothetical protein